ncbi:MAG: hypothetical protein L6Q54_06385 [Leptospiraceae bacterium]|nr:hypothetical protein [Leptospiraceae bacterium]MCK6380864.1 hypothetical protein [Leptospiraceae bacterium]
MKKKSKKKIALTKGKKKVAKKKAKKIISLKSKKRVRKIVAKATRVKLNKEIVHETNPNQAA